MLGKYSLEMKKVQLDLSEKSTVIKLQKQEIKELRTRLQFLEDEKIMNSDKQSKKFQD